MEMIAGGGQLDAVATAQKERLIEPFLERLDAGACRRLGDVQVLGRAVEIAGGGDLEKGPDVVDTGHRPIAAI